MLISDSLDQLYPETEPEPEPESELFLSASHHIKPFTSSRSAAVIRLSLISLSLRHFSFYQLHNLTTTVPPSIHRSINK
jgi:hypothetical protein